MCSCKLKHNGAVHTTESLENIKGIKIKDNQLTVVGDVKLEVNTNGTPFDLKIKSAAKLSIIELTTNSLIVKISGVKASGVDIQKIYVGKDFVKVHFLNLFFKEFPLK